MSIEFAPSLDRAARAITTRNTSAPLAQPESRTTLRRREANRRNARLSTGPRTTAGKRRSSQNALTHGLCAATAIPPCEDGPTFNMFLDELRKEMQPATVMQNILFPQIANLIWRLRRLPEAQAELFQLELDKAATSDAGETLSPSQILARRFSDDAGNGFILLARYERSCQNMLLRLQRQYDQLKKQSTRRPDDPDERVPREYTPAAPSPAALAQQEIAFLRRKDELEQFMPPRNEREANMDRALRTMAEQKRAAPKLPPKQLKRRKQNEPNRSHPKTRRAVQNRRNRQRRCSRQ